jgi:hypothetical protein
MNIVNSSICYFRSEDVILQYLVFVVKFLSNDVDMVPIFLVFLHIPKTFHPSSFLLKQKVLVFVLDLQLYLFERE